jgi:hypothetical protein
VGVCVTQAPTTTNRPAVAGSSRVKPLDEVLAYQNDEVVLRFCLDFGVSRADADDIFLETKRWLWLCASEIAASSDGVGERIPLFSQARIIDLMWHTFLIFTKDYTQFCQRHFGFYVHHQPRTSVEKAAWDRLIADDREAAVAERRQMLRRGYELIHDRLGKDILVKWCEDFPSRFPDH